MIFMGDNGGINDNVSSCQSLSLVCNDIAATDTFVHNIQYNSLGMLHVVLFCNLLLNRTGAILVRWLDGRRHAALIMLVCDICCRLLLLPYYAKEVATFTYMR